MTESERQLLALIRLAITGEPQDELQGDIDWETVYALAQGHTIEGIIFAGIERLPREKRPKIELLMDWFGQTEYIKRENQNKGKALGELSAMMAKHSISYVVFKGLSAAAVYPDKLGCLRIPGDIDFYVPAWDFSRAVDVFEKEWRVEINKSEIDKHFSFCKDKVPYELHYQMETFGRDKHQRYFARLVDDSLKQGKTEGFDAGGNKVVKLCPELDMILVMKHWMTHLIGEGVGLRQTIDLAMLVNRHKGTVDVATIREYLSGIGYTKAFDAVVAMVERYFDIKWDGYPLCLSGYKNADRLMTTIMKNGNFGRSDYKYKTGKMKRAETTVRFFKHCFRFMNLAPTDILCMFTKRIAISIAAHRGN